MIQTTPKAQRGFVAVITPLIVMLSLIGCGSLLEVELPRDISQESTADPSLANLITNSVRSTMECAMASHQGGASMWGPEMSHGSGVGSGGGMDIRSDEPPGSSFTCIDRDDFGLSIAGSMYVAMAHGRDMTRVVEDALAAGDVYPDAQKHLALRATYTAHVLAIFGEAHCGAVFEPNGPILSRTQMLNEAETWFTKGILAAQAAGEATTESLALAGRARVRLNLGNLSGAADDAGAIPQGFVFNITRSASPQTRVNLHWKYTWKTKYWTVEPMFRNLMVQGVPDPRVQVQDMQTTTIDGTQPLFNPLKFSASDTELRLVSWEEAQLIIAEVQLGQTAVDRINALRQAHAGLPLYTPVDVNDDQEILNQVIDDRAREFFLEGRLMADMIRFRGTPQENHPMLVFQQGLEPRGLREYEDNYCWEVPSREIDNNPNAER